MPFYVFGKEYDNLLPEITQEKAIKKKDVFKLTIMNEEDQDEEEDLDIDDEEQYSDDEFMQEEYDLKVVLQTFVTRLESGSLEKYMGRQLVQTSQFFMEYHDEFNYFNSNIRTCLNGGMNSNKPNLLNIIQNQLEPQIRDYLKTVAQSRRIELMQDITDEARSATVVDHQEPEQQSRKILKIKRRNN